MVNGTDQSKILDAKGAPSAAAQPAEKAADEIAMQITISAFEDGRIVVNGAIQNKMAAYGLLETAKDIIRAHLDQALAPKVATPQTPGFFRALLNRKNHIAANRR